MIQKLLAGVASFALMTYAATAVAQPDAGGASEATWTGFYIGVHGGYGWGDVDGDVDLTSGGFISLFEEASVFEGDQTTISVPSTDSGGGFEGNTFAELLEFLDARGAVFDDEEEFSDGDFDGFLGGGQIGFNVQTGGFVFGIEGDFSATDFDGGESGAVATFTISDRAALLADEVEENDEPDSELDGIEGEGSRSALFGSEIEWLGTVRGRVGGAFGSALIYATGGVAFGDVSASGAISTTFAGNRIEAVEDGDDADDLPDVIDVGDSDFGTSTTLSGSESGTEVGYVIGGGVEYAFGGNWSAKIEYNYVNFGDVEVQLVDEDGLDAGDAVDVEVDLHLVKGGINYRF